ncbi:EAL domain-containing protein [Thermaerobacter sp. PB12/4term]|nr:EAL domain-containing protein [Thermaerobacter sp. PB12/4term]
MTEDGLKRLDLEIVEADVALQPIVSVAGGSVVAYEALLRVRAAGGVILLPQALMTGGVPPRLLGRLEREAHARALDLPRFSGHPDTWGVSPGKGDPHAGYQAAVSSRVPGRSRPPRPGEWEEAPADCRRPRRLGGQPAEVGSASRDRRGAAPRVDDRRTGGTQPAAAGEPDPAGGA